MSPIRCIIFAKAPIAGFAKTRLIPALGAEGAARLATQMLQHTLETAIAANVGRVELCVSPSPNDAVWQHLDLPYELCWSAQGEGDLGERMARATERALRKGESVILLGTDCPAISAETLRQVASVLHQHDVCMIPAFDGGYVLMGLNQYDASLFNGIRWSTDSVAQVTLEKIQQLNWTCQLFSKLHDIDEAADLVYLPAAWSHQAALSTHSSN